MILIPVAEAKPVSKSDESQTISRVLSDEQVRILEEKGRAKILGWGGDKGGCCLVNGEIYLHIKVNGIDQYCHFGAILNYERTPRNQEPTQPILPSPHY